MGRDACVRSEIRIYLTREGMPFGVFDIGLPYVHDYSKEEIKIFEKSRGKNFSVSVKKAAFCMKNRLFYAFSFIYLSHLSADADGDKNRADRAEHRPDDAKDVTGFGFAVVLAPQRPEDDREHR